MQNFNFLIALNSPFHHRYNDQVISIQSTVLPTSADCTRDKEMKIKTKWERESARKKSRDRQRKHRKSLNEDMRNFIRKGNRKRICKAQKVDTSTPETPNFPVGHCRTPWYFGGLSISAGLFEDEDYCPSFSILLKREELM